MSREHPAGSKLSPADLIPDGALRSVNGDKFEHDAVAAVVADLATSVRTSANIALFGPWGSGKSSLFSLIEARLTSDPWHRVAVVRYDAWKFAGPGLHRNFLSAVVQQLKLSDRDKAHIEGGTETSRLRLGSYFVRNWPSIVGAVIVAVLTGAAWAMILGWARTDFGSWDETRAQIHNVIANAGTAFGLVIAGLILSNQSLSSALEKRTRSPLQDADQFFAAFDQMMQRLTRTRSLRVDKQVNRLVVFVDELDRCAPSTVVDSLVQLMTYLGHPRCVFLVAADRQVLEEALENAPQAKPLREDEPYYSTSGAFLDKVFQYQIELPPTRPEALTAYALALADEAKGIWKELRDIGQREYEDVLYALVPSHVRSPRRVKILMNDFATTARVMEQRGMSWRRNAVQVAIMTVLQTEFPSVARDFLIQPRLLDALVGIVSDPSTELMAAVEKYAPSALGTASPAPLLVDTAAQAELLAEKPTPLNALQLGVASQRLREQLHAYLARMRAAGSPMPTPDLVYVQGAAHSDGLVDERLSRLLDIAADVAPDDLVPEFSTASQGDLSAAVKFLIAQLGNKFGPLRANLVESAARLAFMLDADAARQVAAVASAPILGEVTRGRWRPGMTPGAIWLGLLDPRGPGPLNVLSQTGELDDLAESGALAKLIPRMDALGTASDQLFPHFGRSFARHPELIARCLEELAPSVATRLWASCEDEVVAWFRDHPVEVSTSGTAVATPSATDEGEETLARYGGLLDAACTHEGDDRSVVVRALLEVAASAPALIPLPLVRRETLANRLTADDRNGAALSLLATSTDEDQVLAWCGWLDPAVDSSPTLASRAGESCATFLLGATNQSSAHQLGEGVAIILGWLDPVGADRLAQGAAEQLASAPYDGTSKSQSLRLAARNLLDQLDRAFPLRAYGDSAFLNSLTAALHDGEVSDAACHQLLAETRRLSADKARLWDAALAANKASTNHSPSVTRLRIAARSTAGLAPLKASEVIPDAPDSSVGPEWVKTNPPIGEFMKYLQKIKPAAATLATYAALRNTRDRSRIWIYIERTGLERDRLEAVGSRGVDESVVQHMISAIKGVNLTDQTAAVQRLITADLDTSTATRSAANDLTLELLQTMTAGAGSNAAKLAISSGGAAPKRKAELRDAFDAYFQTIPKNHVPKRELQELEKLNLITRRKKSPLASVLGWLR